MHSTSSIPGPLATMEWVASVVIGVRATRQSHVGQRARPARADGAPRADATAKRCYARVVC